MEFTPGSVHKAVPTFSNPKTAGFDYTATLCMGAGWTEMASAPFHLDAGQSKGVEFSVTMPSAPGTYPVYFKVSSGGVIIGTFVATENVIIAVSLADKCISMVKAHPGVFGCLAHAVPDLWNLFWATMTALQPVAGPGLVVPPPPAELLFYFPGYPWYGMAGIDYNAALTWFLPRMTAAQMTSFLGYAVAALLAAGYTPQMLIEWTT